MKKIIIIDDHQLLREGINSWVSSNSDWQVLAKYTNDEIAETMDISKRSVENYLSRIYDKTGTNNKQQLLDYLEQN